MAKEGVDVAICARRKEPLEKAAAEIARATNRKIVAIPADLRKDADAGKQTFLSLLGLNRAREQAAMLVDQAIGHLSGCGDEADILRAVARYVLDRDH